MSGLAPCLLEKKMVFLNGATPSSSQKLEEKDAGSRRCWFEGVGLDPRCVTTLFLSVMGSNTEMVLLVSSGS